MDLKNTPWTDDPRDLLRVGEGFSLADFDRGGKPGWGGKKSDWEAFAPKRGELMSELQERLFAEAKEGGNRSLLVVVQGLDTAGKGGIARHVMGLVDPQGVALRSFGVPTKEELSHHYLWRIKKALPPAGRIGLFDRSHYEDVLVARVDSLVPEAEWSKRYDEINAFEKDLVEGGTTVLKFALMVSHEEQGLRLMERLDRPDKRWKFSGGDLDTRSKWDAYQEAYQAVFDLTSTEHAPWYVLPADRKWYSRAAATEIITQSLIEMAPEYPQPDWDVFEMREKLAQQMSASSLEESLADTEASVQSAIDNDELVRAESIAIGAAASDLPPEAAKAEADARLARAEADRAAWRAELARTQEQKKRLAAEARERTA